MFCENILLIFFKSTVHLFAQCILSKPANEYKRVCGFEGIIESNIAKDKFQSYYSGYNFHSNLLNIVL
jgi:hypothetical protein